MAAAVLDRDWREVSPTLEQHYRAVECTPRGGEALCFTTVVPRDWLVVTRAGGLPEGLGIATPIACFFESAGPHSPAFFVTQTPIGYEVPLKDWLQLAITDGGWEIVQERWVETIRGVRREVLARRKAAGYWWIRRTTAWIDAGRVLRIEAVATANDWPRVDQLLWPTTRSVQLLHGPPRAELEPRRSVTHPDEPRLSIVVPQSWTVEPTAGSRPGCAALDLGLVRGGRWDAQVQVRFDAGAAPTMETGEHDPRAVRILRRAGVVPARRFEVEPWPQGEAPAPYLGAHVRTASTPSGPALVRTAYVTHPDGGVGLIAIVPYPARPLDILRCTRTFEIAAETCTG